MPKAKIMIIEDEDLQYEIYEECLDEFEIQRAKSAVVPPKKGTSS